MYRKRALFYPCAGADIQAPVQAFSAIVDEFWFVDCNYYTRRQPRVMGRHLDLETVERVLPQCAAKVMTQKYTHSKFNKSLEVNLVTGDGKSVFDELFATDHKDRSLSIFFHRGDSQGESGSDVFWLDVVDCEGKERGHLDAVLGQLESPGIICSDGSNAASEFRRYFDDLEAPPDTHRSLASFELLGRKLLPVGSLDIRYGPTTIWQVK